MIWKMLILGFIQGVTEFLPVSSSGHLLLGQELLNVEGGFTIPIFLHLGTLVAAIIFMSRRIGRLFRDMFNQERQRRIEGWKLVLYLVIASIPAAIVAFLAGDAIEQTIYAQPMYVSFFLIGTGALLLATRWGRDREKGFSISDAILVGLVQAVAILPGFSRSGLTIGTALLLGIASEEAFEFSFLLSIPAIAGASLFEFLELSDAGGFRSLGPPAAWITGFLTSAVVGLLALWILKKAVVSRKFWLFSFYCFGIGLVSLVFLLAFK